MGAALVEDAQGTTQDLGLWFGRIDAEKLGEAARRAGGFYTPGFGAQPPALGGEGLERVDIVLTASGMEPFDEEYARSSECAVDGLRIKVLPLERVIAIERAANRPKDAAQIPFLEAALTARRGTGERA
jgi:hypothetical protein